MKSILLTIALSLTAFVLPVQSAAQHSSYSEQKFIADRCRSIRAQAWETYSQNAGLLAAVRQTEDYLMAFHSELAMQMLGDLQAAGSAGYANWCSKYGI